MTGRAFVPSATRESPASTSPPGHPAWPSWNAPSTASPAWSPSWTASPWRCWHSTSQATGSSTPGQYPNPDKLRPWTTGW